MSVARAAVDRLGECFLGGEVDAVLAEFAASGPVVYAGSERGEVALGRSALSALLHDLMSRDERYSWRAEEVHEIVDGDTVHLVAEAELTVHVPDADAGWRPDERLPYRLSGVLQREAGPGPEAWRWRLCLGSEPAAASPQELPRPTSAQ
jgi:hypothetical protein